MDNYNTCKQCGAVKPLTQYRRYYGGRTGHYKTCRLCEKINSREKYLSRKERTKAEDDELQKIYTLWEEQRRQGLRPPRTSEASVGVLDVLTKQLVEYANNPTPSINSTTAPPKELLSWLTIPLTNEPDYYLDEVYETLRSIYRPTLYIDQVHLVPVYDDTHLETLNAILDRFNAYEDAYWNKEDK